MQFKILKLFYAEGVKVTVLFNLHPWSPRLWHSKSRASVTAAAIFETKISAKGALSVVTGGTGRPAGRREMLRGRGGTDLPHLWRACSQAVTVSAGEPVAWPMISVTESVSVGARVDRRRPIGLLVMANAARGDLASRRGLACGSVTTVTAIVGHKVRRDRQRNSAIRRSMTTVATRLWLRRSAHVLRVIELHVETLIEARGETLQRRIAALRIAVADQTHRDRRRRELSAMTVRASFVTRKARRRRVISPFVT